MNEEKVIQTILQLEAEVQEIKETMMTKSDHRELLDGQDKMIRILERIDHERVATKSAIDRHEERITRLEKHPVLAT